MPASLYLRLFWTLIASFCVLGICIAFVQPLFSVPDEFTHWNAGHARFERLLGSHDCVPTFNPERNRRRHQPLPPFEKLRATPLQCMNGEDLYGDVLTYPGLLASKLLLPNQRESSLRQMQAIVLTRLLQGLIFVACLLRLGTHSLRAERNGPLLAAAFSLSPLLAQQAFGVSADGVQLSFAVCLVSAILFWDKLAFVDFALFLVLGWGATAKPFVLTCIVPSVLAGYWYAQLRGGETPSLREVLQRLWTSLKPGRRPTPQTLILWTALFLTAATVLLALLNKPDASTPISQVPGANGGAQLDNLRSHPELIFEITARQVPEPWLVRNYVGPLGWLDARLSPVVTHSFLRLIGIAFILEIGFAWWWYRGRGVRLSDLGARVRAALPPLLIGMAGVVANVFFVAFVLYVTWTPVGAARPEGIQARYHFATVLTLIAVVCGAASVLFEPHPDEAAIAATTAEPAGRLFRLIRVSHVLGPLLILAFTLPYVARVFLDLEQRYY